MMDSFRHEAFLYRDDDEFVDATSSFVRDGLEAGEPVLVTLRAERNDLLRAALEDDGVDSLQFIDMADLGRNPARIIPAWRAFVEHARPKAVRGIGEPVWRGRSADELLECGVHELLVNLAFSDGPEFWLLCPYDAGRLDSDNLDDARMTHPVVVEGGARRASVAYSADQERASLAGALPEPPGDTGHLSFGADTLGDARRWVGRYAAGAGLAPDKAANLVLAAHEVAANSVRHGGGCGRLRTWRSGPSVIVEVSDTGLVGDPLAGRIEPGQDGSGRGLWLVNHLCDLVQLRSSPSGTVVRLHMQAG